MPDDTVATAVIRTLPPPHVKVQTARFEKLRDVALREQRARLWHFLSGKNNPNSLGRFAATFSYVSTGSNGFASLAGGQWLDVKAVAHSFAIAP